MPGFRAVLHGQIWRPCELPHLSAQHGFIWILFSMYFYYHDWGQLERQWELPLQPLFLTGILGHIIAAAVIYFATGLTGIFFPMTTDLYQSVAVFRLRGLLPECGVPGVFCAAGEGQVAGPAGWLSCSPAAFLILCATASPVSAVYFSDAVCAVLALLNFFVFFLMTRNLKRYNLQGESTGRGRTAGRCTRAGLARGTSARSAGGRSWTGRTWSFATAPNARGITSTARITCSPTSM